MTDFVEFLPRLKGKDVYFSLNKENPDWNESVGVELSFRHGGESLTLSLDDVDQSSYLASSLHHVLDGGNALISWCAKDVFSFLKGRTGIGLELKGKIYDLSVISSYLGMEADKPKTFREAVALLKSCLSDPGWEQFKSFYFGVYEPLFSEVLPEIETCCLVDNKRRSCVYATYVIEGQVNGRLRTVKTGRNSYNPHSMGPDDKRDIRPQDYDDVFLYFDYRNMEVNVLQWLSGDGDLARVLESGSDPYKEIWRIITRQEPTEGHRKICKDIFLPVVFGQGKSSLAAKLKISEEIASRLIHSLGKTFPVAFDWVNSQSTNGNNTATDAFGRKRTFDGREQYKVKNFCIQSPASMICLRKLVRLHEALASRASICFHVHDGYYVLCKKSEINSIAELGIRTLEEDDSMFPGLAMRVSCRAGDRLDDMRSITLTKRVSI
jgi:hypothetical protein